MDTYPAVPCLRYNEIRDQIRTGDILLCSGTRLMSRLIQRATQSCWSHVGFLRRDDLLERIMVLESIESVGVWTVPFSHYIANYRGCGRGYAGRIFIARDRRFAGLTDRDLMHFSQEAIDRFGWRYDTRELAWIRCRLLCARLHMPVPPRRQNNAYICSEYAELCYASVGLTYTPVNPTFIAPRDFPQSPEVDILWELEVEHHNV